MESSSRLLVLLFFLYEAKGVQSIPATHSLPSCLLSANIHNFTLLPYPTAEDSPALYYQLLNASIRNLRVVGPAVPKPAAIIVPETKQHLLTAILCCRRTSVAIRILSGGHSYEGLSYVGQPGKPFAIIDLMKLNQVTVNTSSATAWVESGATLGEIYGAIAESSRTLAFSAGSCPTVGSGGHISGGGFGLLSRRYGLAADNVMDAILISPDGRFLDRKSMGEDVFWAIRGGGGGSWGAVYAWLVRLVPVPELVTVFGVSRKSSSRKAAELVYKWQYVSPRLPDEFYLSTTISGDANGSISTSFSGLYLGRRAAVMSMLSSKFPELEVVESDCTEMSWIDSVVHYAGVGSVAELSDRPSPARSYFKAKSDYVRSPLTVDGLTGALDWLSREPAAYAIFDPYGGAMGRIRSDHLPFPHRAGNIYGIQYNVAWTADDDGRRDWYIEWMDGMYKYMEPWVSRNPRAAYVNYVDLDLGTTVESARVWGIKYFLGNFDRLVRAKNIIDPDNVFSNAQSIPPTVRV